jgi:hypothetical protein
LAIPPLEKWSRPDEMEMEMEMGSTMEKRK